MGRYRQFTDEQLQTLKVEMLTMAPKELAVKYECSIPTIYKYLKLFRPVLNQHGQQVGNEEVERVA
jgi:hypothetical protein